ncbi:MAG: hypothetical protein ACLS9G_00040 [Akkermansia sp.]
MKLAVRHATAIVRSVRLLGGNTRREEGVNADSYGSCCLGQVQSARR